MIKKYLRYSLPFLLSLPLACGESTKPEINNDGYFVNASQGAFIQTQDVNINIPPNSLRDNTTIEVRSLDEEVEVASNLSQTSKIIRVDFNTTLEDTVSFYLKNPLHKVTAQFDSTNVVLSEHDGVLSIRDFRIENNDIVIKYEPTPEERNDNDLEIKIWASKSSSPEPILYTRDVDPKLNDNIILLIHGLGSHPSTFDRNPDSPENTIFKHLNREFSGRVISFYYPTDRLPLENAESLYNLLVTWGLESPLDIIGHSMGGIVARDFVRRYHDEFQIPHFIQIAAPNNGFTTINIIDSALEFLVNNFEAHEIDIFNPYTSRGARALVEGSEYLESLNTALDHRLNNLYYVLYGKGNRWLLSPIIPGDDDGLINLGSSYPSHPDFPRSVELYIGSLYRAFDVNHWDILPYLGVEGCNYGCAIVNYLRETP